MGKQKKRKQKKTGGEDMSVLENLQPKRVFYYFEELTKIPHGSGNTKEISDYLVQFAREIGRASCRERVFRAV